MLNAAGRRGKGGDGDRVRPATIYERRLGGVRTSDGVVEVVSPVVVRAHLHVLDDAGAN